MRNCTFMHLYQRGAITLGRRMPHHIYMWITERKQKDGTVIVESLCMSKLPFTGNRGGPLPCPRHWMSLPNNPGHRGKTHQQLHLATARRSYQHFPTAVARAQLYSVCEIISVAAKKTQNNQQQIWEHSEFAVTSIKKVAKRSNTGTFQSRPDQALHITMEICQTHWREETYVWISKGWLQL